MFRRAAFNWALSTKRLVESSAALGNNTKVAHAALEDIEYARELLDGLFMPGASKTPAAFADKPSNFTAQAVQDSVANLAFRVSPVVIAAVPSSEPKLTLVKPLSVKKPRVHGAVTDLTAPVYSKNGKALWASIDCVVCPSKATERCRREDGAFMEKPHPKRKTMAAEEGEKS